MHAARHRESEGANEKSNTGYSRKAPGQSHHNRTVTLRCLPNEGAGADSGKMQHGRRDQETGGIGDTAGILWDFRSVSVTADHQRLRRL